MCVSAHAFSFHFIILTVFFICGRECYALVLDGGFHLHLTGKLSIFSDACHLEIPVCEILASVFNPFSFLFRLTSLF